VAGLLTITIKSTCLTKPPHPHMGGGGFNTVRWHSAPPEFYILRLPGGYFEGYPIDFQLPVPTSGFTGTLTLVKSPPAAPIVNYIYDKDGRPCITLADPPDIIIDSSFIKRPSKKPVKKKPAKKKK